ncbi:3-methyladenine DNA glycosylase [Pannonibacter phragmitetus]|uniref:DNA-3-methyladenine glycosylase I n=1 Tax=Pannonibacter phragmitetus TaxID=121719 RepID=UPI00067D98F6|nr:DNA-3-methyladenine glycosylase I [Pannonibacter phragmitetus]KND20056.1 3-methyladenine DNA glycosylase [Pannonibacter phragmitetus]
MDGLIEGPDGQHRCKWYGGLEDYLIYHDEEWGWPVTDDHRLFEKICLEGFQSGLSWLTILRKREGFRAAFAGFDFNKVAEFGEDDIARCLADTGIVRHRGKIVSTINNARRAIELKAEFGSLAAYFWRFEPKPEARPLRCDRATLSQITQSAESVALSKDLKKRGWSFVGPTTVYAFMQAMGLVNDHLEGCCRRAPLEAHRATFARPVAMPA